MNIDRAIEIQTIHNDHNPNITDAERREAHQLGIEALKEIRYLKRMDADFKDYILPSETKD